MKSFQHIKWLFVLLSIVAICLAMSGCGLIGNPPTTQPISRTQQLSNIQFEYTSGMAAVNFALAIGGVDPTTVSKVQTVMDAIETAITKAQADLAADPNTPNWQVDVDAIESALTKVSPLFQKAKSVRKQATTKPVSLSPSSP